MIPRMVGIEGTGLRVALFLYGVTGLSEVRYWMIYSAVSRGDYRAAREYLADAQGARPEARVYRWVPGDHYHALDGRFDTYDEARRHLESKGYRCLGLEERHVYPRGGD